MWHLRGVSKYSILTLPFERCINLFHIDLKKFMVTCDGHHELDLSLDNSLYAISLADDEP
jgi:hypothetical protein